jgi:hypothetical protein
MATRTTTNILRPPKGPNIPIAPTQYDQRYIDQIMNALRLYFNQIDNFGTGLLNGSGTSSLIFPYGAWADSATQTAAANTVTLITYNSTYSQNDITLDTGLTNSKFTFLNAGNYNFAFSIQADNSGIAADNLTLWMRQNGVDIPNSAGISAIPAKHGLINGALVFGWNTFITAAAGDYVQMYWTTDSGNSRLVTYPASAVAPIHPASPSAAVNINFVSASY